MVKKQNISIFSITSTKKTFTNFSINILSHIFFLKYNDYKININIRMRYMGKKIINDQLCASIIFFLIENSQFSIDVSREL